jgi:hypothetical protein
MRVGLNPWENQVQGEWLGTGTVTQENSGIAAVVPTTQNSILSSHSPRYSWGETWLPTSGHQSRV